MLPDNKITIGFLSPKSLEDKRFLSGTFYTMAKALESTGRVVWIPVRWLGKSSSRLCPLVGLPDGGCSFACAQHMVYPMHLPH